MEAKALLTVILDDAEGNPIAWAQGIDAELKLSPEDGEREFLLMQPDGSVVSLPVPKEAVLVRIETDIQLTRPE